MQRMPRYLLRKCHLTTVGAALLLGVYLLTGSVAAQAPRRVETSQPPNLGNLKERLRTYKSTGAYDRDLRKVAAEAEACIKDLAKRTTRPALVLDIDETALSNWPQLIANDFGYIPGGSCRLFKGPCGSRAWELLGRAPVIEPTLKLFRAASASGVSIFFITGRDETERSATVANLRRAGYRG